jgi:hypothetical protein
MTTAELAQRAFQHAFQQAIVLLNARGEVVTLEDVAHAADRAVTWTAEIFPDSPVSREVLQAELEANTRVIVSAATFLAGDSSNHVDWLNAKRSEIDWRFYGAYRQWLMHNGRPGASIREEHRDTDRILSQLEDPERDGPWDRRGMVVGAVQSGKTSNYVALICKAADAGYRMIVVLAGMHNSLRSQTQQRIDEGFLGLDSETTVAFNKTNRAVGVGTLSHRHPDALTLTQGQETGDFSKKVATQVIGRVKSVPTLLVVKKNATILRNLIEWLRGNHQILRPGADAATIPDLPLLVIDDEADNASVNTKLLEYETDEDGHIVAETDPTTINRRIRELLKLFEKSAYVGYTATPFANIFIAKPEKESPTYGPDLFPEDFIVRVKPPSNYLGPAQLFGVASRDDPDGVERVPLPIIRQVTDYDNWLEDRHKKDAIPGPVPPSLRGALRAFVLTSAARMARGQSDVHNSMLVHVTRFQDVQAHVARQVSDEIERMQNRLQFGEGDASETLLRKLESDWRSDFEPTIASMPEEWRGPQLPWDDIRPHLKAAVARIEVLTINGYAREALEYKNRRAISVIAVGGDKLSRGLTLEGLSISYYLRASRMYDTLMQMGRWFGYRPGYQDLCRLYTTPELQHWYRQISIANSELLARFDEMAAIGARPGDFALYVRESPDGLMVTARAKMRDGTRMQVAFSRELIETTTFERDPKVQHANVTRCEGFFDELAASDLPQTTHRGNPVWQNVTGTRIAELLDGWLTPGSAQKADGAVLARYIRNRLDADELTDWTVNLISVRDTQRRHTFGGVSIGMSERSADQLTAPPYNLYVVKHVGNRIDEFVDIELLGDDGATYRRALAASKERYRRGETRSKREPNEPLGPEIRQVRPPTRGVLSIYPLMPDPAKIDGWTKGPIMGFAVSFPFSEGAPSISYVVPNRYWGMEFDE